MIALVSRLFSRGEPVVSEAAPRDAAAIAVLHGASFRRGWSEDEVERLLGDRQVVAHRVSIGRTLAGFVLSRIAADEAEILSIAVTGARRKRGLARALLSTHLRWLAGRGVTAVFLEVDENNAAARRLYQRAGFRQVGVRQGYYRDGGGNGTAALVLRRDLA